MPAGVDWFPYLRVALASFFSAAAGAQVVHTYYKPDLTIPETPPEKGQLAKLRKMQQEQPKDGNKDIPQESASEDVNVKRVDQPSAES
ncbi:ubiquinol-cytochrome-c reductase complex assembly factor 6-like [Amphiura filiformis]|uniref:ubiquinol-cytochrome-c reductase complex assembly factor 6-like n=1 Tax=Amphiura filiformis TaxID=82378 RepID=UPI003B2136BC